MSDRKIKHTTSIQLTGATVDDLEAWLTMVPNRATLSVSTTLPDRPWDGTYHYLTATWNDPE